MKIIQECKKYKKHLFLFILLALAALVLLLIAASENVSPSNSDSLEYAQIARSIVTRKEMCLNSYPLSGLVLLKKIDRLNPKQCWPNLNRFFLFPISLALFFKVFGVSLKVIPLLNGFYFFAALIIFYLFAYRLFGLKSAFLGGLVFIFDYWILDHTLFGVTEILDIFLLSLTLYLLCRSKISSYYWAAFVFGLSYLDRYANLFFLLPLLLYIWFSLKKAGHLFKLRVILLFCLVFFITISPLLIYNFYYTKNPLSSLQASSLIAGATSILPGDPMAAFDQFKLYSPLVFLKNHPLVSFQKSWRMIFYQTQEFYLFCAFLFVFLFYQSQNTAVKKMKLLILSLLLIQTIAYSFFALEFRYYLIFVPFLIIFGLNFLIENIKSKTKFAMVFCVLIIIQISALVQDKTIRSRLPSAYYPQEYQSIQEETQADDIILGPSKISWFSDRKNVAPIYRSDLPTLVHILEQEYVLPKGIYLDVKVDGYGHRIPVSFQGEIPGFYLKNKFESGALYFERID